MHVRNGPGLGLEAAHAELQHAATALGGVARQADIQIPRLARSSTDRLSPSRPHVCIRPPTRGSPAAQAAESEPPDSRTADVWACGVLLHFMLTAALPGLDVGGRGARCAPYDPPRSASAEARCLLRRMLVADPARRASVPEVMKSPWFLQDCPEVRARHRTPAPPSDKPLAASPRTAGCRDGHLLAEHGVCSRATWAHPTTHPDQFWACDLCICLPTTLPAMTSACFEGWCAMLRAHAHCQTKARQCICLMLAQVARRRRYKCMRQ